MDQTDTPVDTWNVLPFIVDAANDHHVQKRLWVMNNSMKKVYYMAAAKDQGNIDAVNNYLPRLLGMEDALVFVDQMIPHVKEILTRMQISPAVCLESIQLLRNNYFADPVNMLGTYANAEQMINAIAHTIRRQDFQEFVKPHSNTIQWIIDAWSPFCSAFPIKYPLYLFAKGVTNSSQASVINSQLANCTDESIRQFQRQFLDQLSTRQAFSDDNYNILVKRLAFSRAKANMIKDSAPRRTTQDADAATNTSAEFVSMATILANHTQLPMFVDLMVDLMKLIAHRFEKGAPADDISMHAIVDATLQLASKLEGGDHALFFVEDGAGLPDAVTKWLRKSNHLDLAQKVAKAFVRTISPSMPKPFAYKLSAAVTMTKLQVDVETIPKFLDLIDDGLTLASSALMQAAIANTDAFAGVLRRILLSEDPNYKTLITVLLSTGQKGKSAMFAPHVDVLRKLVATKGTTALAAPVLASLASTNVELFMIPESFDETITAIEANPQANTMLPISQSVLAICKVVIQKHDHDMTVVVLDRLSKRLEVLYKTQATHTKYADALVMCADIFKAVAVSDLKDILDPYKPLLETISNDVDKVPANAREAFSNVLNELGGVTLAALRKQLYSTMNAIGVDPDDPFYDAVKNAQENQAFDKYDVMLSYNWSHQKIVLRIRDSLTARGFKVWMDLDQMAGNVYAKMAEAVLGSDVIIPCLTAAYEASGNCKRELGFAADQTRAGKKIVPVRLENYSFTWSALITAGLLYTYIGESELGADGKWNFAMDGLAKEVRAALPEPKVEPVAASQSKSNDDNKATMAQTSTEETTPARMFDVMLSYNWAHQGLVLKVKDYLQHKAGLRVWMDVDEMSGNVYGKMAEAVMKAHVVVPFLTSKYEQSGNCKREFEFASMQAKKAGGTRIVPVKVTPESLTWTADVVKDMACLELSPDSVNDDVIWTEKMKELTKLINARLNETDQTKQPLLQSVEQAKLPSVITASISGSTVQSATDNKNDEASSAEQIARIEDVLQMLEGTTKKLSANQESVESRLTRLEDAVATLSQQMASVIQLSNLSKEDYLDLEETEARLLKSDIAAFLDSTNGQLLIDSAVGFLRGVMLDQEDDAEWIFKILKILGTKYFNDPATSFGCQSNFDSFSYVVRTWIALAAIRKHLDLYPEKFNDEIVKVWGNLTARILLKPLIVQLAPESEKPTLKQSLHDFQEQTFPKLESVSQIINSSSVQIQRELLRQAIKRLRDAPVRRKEREQIANLSVETVQFARSLLEADKQFACLDLIFELFMAVLDKAKNSGVSLPNLVWLLEIAQTTPYLAASFTTFASIFVLNGAALLKEGHQDKASEFVGYFLDNLAENMGKDYVNMIASAASVVQMSLTPQQFEKLLDLSESGFRDVSNPLLISLSLQKDPSIYSGSFAKIFQSQNKTLLLVLLSTAALQPNSLFAPYLSDLVSLASSKDTGLATIAAQAIGGIAAHDATLFNSETLLDAILTTIESNKSIPTAFPVNNVTIQILSSMTLSTDSTTCILAIDKTMDRVQKLLDARASLSKHQALMMLTKPLSDVSKRRSVSPKIWDAFVQWKTVFERIVREDVGGPDVGEMFSGMLERVNQNVRKRWTAGAGGVGVASFAGMLAKLDDDSSKAEESRASSSGFDASQFDKRLSALEKAVEAIQLQLTRLELARSPGATLTHSGPQVENRIKALENSMISIQRQLSSVKP